MIDQKIIYFFFQNKNSTNRQFKKNQPHFSDDESYFHQNQQQYNINEQRNPWNDIDQPDDSFQPEFFGPYINSHQPRRMQKQPSEREKLGATES